MCLPLLIPLSTFPPGHLAGGPLDVLWLILLAVVGALALWGGWVGGGRKAGVERERTALPLRTNCRWFPKSFLPRRSGR